MREVVDLNKIRICNSMHDQRIDKVKCTDDRLELYFKEFFLDSPVSTNREAKAYYEKYKKYMRCRISFVDIDVPTAEVRKGNRLRRIAKIYNMDEFIRFLNKKRYSIEVIDFYCSYQTVIIEGALWHSKHYYCGECILKISASHMIYEWK